MPDDAVPPPEVMLPIFGALLMILTAAVTALVQLIWTVKIVRTIRRDSRLPVASPEPATPS